MNPEHTIWKYTLDVLDTQEIRMPRGARLLCVQAQGDRAQLWAVVDPEAPEETRTFRTIETGHPFEDPGTLLYFDTYQLHGGRLVYHVFEVPST